jgi:hypothetical protein
MDKPSDEERARWRAEAIASMPPLPPRIKERIKEEEPDENDEYIPRPPPPLGNWRKNKTADPTGLGSAISSPEPDEVREPVNVTTTLNDTCCQATKSPKRAKLRDDSPAYFINKKLANCRELTSTDRCCVGLLNFLMKNKDGYAWVGYPQLAHWLGLKNSDVAYNLMRKLSKNGFIRDEGDYRGKHRWVVRDEWRDPVKKLRPRKPSVRDDDEQIPF